MSEIWKERESEREKRTECPPIDSSFPEGNWSSTFLALQHADKQSQLYPQHAGQLNGSSVWAAGLWSFCTGGGLCRPDRARLPHRTSSLPNQTQAWLRCYCRPERTPSSQRRAGRKWAVRSQGPVLAHSAACAFNCFFKHSYI